MELTLAQIAVVCHGELSPHSTTSQIVNTVTIDSRQATINTMFVALKGEQQDGHDFILDSFQSGAVAVLANRHAEIKQPNVIYVDDTVKALGALAHYYRQQFILPVVAITGSNGKTTVKEMLKGICHQEYGANHVLATTGNFNNHLGMPLTLLQLDRAHKVAILEMGMNHAGELDYLSRIACPTIATINNVMFAHAGFFNDLTDIARAKGEIYHGLMPGGIACINQASPFADLWHAELLTAQLEQTRRVSFGIPGGICYLKATQADGRMVLGTEHGDIGCTLQVLGEHNQVNAVTAATLALLIGCSLASIKAGLEGYAGYAGRLERKQAFNGALIIDDSYNGNPDSVQAAILAIAHLPKPHWCILADLRELGKFSEESHHELGAFAAAHGVDHLVTVGELSKIAYGSFTGDKVHFMQNQDVVEYCLEHLPAAATLLVKGSHSMNLAQVVDELMVTTQRLLPAYADDN